ncbi:MAG: transglutaminase family protein [Streptosporangiaceae bacterium]
MGWRLEIVHDTRVSYDGAVRSSYNEARMTPPTLPRQTALETRLETGTTAAVWHYSDYWGTTVSSFEIEAPHDELAVRARATVETSAPPEAGRPLPWPELTAQATRGRLMEFLAPTPRTTVDERLVAAARQRTAGADPLETAAEIAGWVHGHVAYMPGATGVQTGAQEAWDKGQGVCQDIAHLTVALLRAARLPARYVSGYLHPRPEAEPGDQVAGQSHAWVEFWCGEWTACDPTNLAPVGERHVLVAAGRDYGDVPPLKGIYHGAPGSAMQVNVTLTRLA